LGEPELKILRKVVSSHRNGKEKDRDGDGEAGGSLKFGLTKSEFFGACFGLSDAR
jgi:hypothetical protein